jgi:sugar O-acyltransferase (sialic acid O-acetyltransferase NeuD family)
MHAFVECSLFLLLINIYWTNLITSLQLYIKSISVRLIEIVIWRLSLMNELYILGAGGCARGVLNIIVDLDRYDEVTGFLEEGSKREGEIVNGKSIYDASILKNLDPEKTKIVGAIANPLRKRWIEEVKMIGFNFETLIHPNVVKSKWVKINDGVIVYPGSIIDDQIEIGAHVIINKDCTLGHDISIGDYSTLSPGVHIGGYVTIGEKCFIGLGAVIKDRVSIGAGSLIGAGAVVTKDIPENSLAIGVPAKPVKTLVSSDWASII